MKGDPAIEWAGAKQLEPFLVEIDSLEPWPDNPRRGDVPSVARSLGRWGQVRPILTDGQRIVAGHHVVQAARELGWTKIAAVANDFQSEEEARAYLLADNQLGILGGNDDELLAAQLSSLSDFEGTGWTKQEADDLANRLAALRNPPIPDGDEPPRLDERADERAFEVPLLLDRDGRQDFARHVAMLRREWAVEDTTGVVVRAVREAAERA